MLSLCYKSIAHLYNTYRSQEKIQNNLSCRMLLITRLYAFKNNYSLQLLCIGFTYMNYILHMCIRFVITMTSYWERWRLKSPASPLFTQLLVQAKLKNIKAPRHRWPVNTPHKRPVTRKMFPFGDVIMVCHDLKGAYHFRHSHLITLDHISMVSCQKGPTRHANAWQIGPFWQDTLDIQSAVDRP